MIFLKETIFKGCGVAAVTPLKEDGSVNLKKYAELIDYFINNDADAIIVNGTTGESATLSDEEQYNIVCCAKDVINHRVPLIVGAGSNNTHHAARLALNARNGGADAILCVTPYYNKANENGIIEHYNFIANHSCLPMILYNVPSRTGVNIKPETYLKLIENPYIVAVKEASGNISQIAKIRSICGDELDIYSGNDDCVVPALSIGGKGVISVLANILPNKVHDICSLYDNGKIKEAEELQIKYMPLIDAIFSDVNPIPIKEAMNIMGYNVGTLRLPLYKMPEDKIIKLKSVLEKFNLI